MPLTQLMCVNCGFSEISHKDRAGIKGLPEACDNFQLKSDLAIVRNPDLDELVEMSFKATQDDGTEIIKAQAYQLKENHESQNPSSQPQGIQP